MKKLAFGVLFVCIAIALTGQTSYAEGNLSSFKVYPVKYQLKYDQYDTSISRYDKGYQQNGEWLISPFQIVNLAKSTLKRPSISVGSNAVLARDEVIFSGRGGKRGDTSSPPGIYRWNLNTDKVDQLRDGEFYKYRTDGKFLVTIARGQKQIEIMDISSRKITSHTPNGTVTHIQVDDGILVYVYRKGDNISILVSVDLQTGLERELAVVPYAKYFSDYDFLDIKDHTVVWSYMDKAVYKIFALNLINDADGIPLLVAQTDKLDHTETNGKWVAWDDGQQWKFADITGESARSFEPAIPADEKVRWVNGDTLITQKPHPHPVVAFSTKLYAFEKPNPWDRNLQISIGGRKLAFNDKAVTKNGLTYVPYRAIFESLGYSVKLDTKTKAIKAQRAGRSMEMKVGSTAATVFGKKVKLPGAPLDQKGSGVYVPLNFVVESSGNTVLWNDVKQMADIQPKRTIGKLFYDNGQPLYSGEMVGNDIDGRGTLYREDGSLWYEAVFSKNTVQGYGTIHYPDGSRFEGMFTDGVPTGYGVYKVPSGVIWYRGEFKNGRKDGYGIEYDWELGFFEYAGYWKDNEKHGPGIDRFKQSEEYDAGKKIK